MDFLLSGKRRQALQGAGRGSRGSAGLRGASSTQRSRFFPACSRSIPRARHSPSPAGIWLRGENSLNPSSPFAVGFGSCRAATAAPSPLPEHPEHPTIPASRIKPAREKGGTCAKPSPGSLPSLPLPALLRRRFKVMDRQFPRNNASPRLSRSSSCLSLAQGSFFLPRSCFFSPQIGRLLSCGWFPESGCGEISVCERVLFCGGKNAIKVGLWRGWRSSGSLDGRDGSRVGNCSDFGIHELDLGS